MQRQSTAKLARLDSEKITQIVAKHIFCQLHTIFTQEIGFQKIWASVIFKNCPK
jgi:hypothetical protein